MKKVLFFIIVFGTVWTGCNKYVKFARTGDIEDKSRVAGEITIDSTYELYTRAVYKSYQNSEHVLKTVRRGQNVVGDTLVELEYLLISPKYRNVIYISTICDQYQQRYIGRDEPLCKINVFDFKVLLFGKLLDNDAIRFIIQDNAATDTWYIKRANGNSQIVVSDVKEYLDGEFHLFIPADEALEEPCHFTKVDNWQMEYRTYNDENDPPTVPILKGPVRFRNMARWCTRKPKYRMFFTFNNIVRQGSSATSVYFKNRRIGSRPEKLFDK